MSVLDDVYGKPTGNPLDEVYGKPKAEGSFFERVGKEMKTQFEESWLAEGQRALVRGGRRLKGAAPGTIAGFADIGGGTALAAMQRLMPLPPEQYAEMQEERREMIKPLKEAAKEHYKSSLDPELAPRKGGVGGYVVNLVGEMVPTAVAAIGATIVTGPAGGFIVGGAAESEAHVQEAMQKTGMTEEELANERLLVFMISGAIEQMQADEVLKLSKAGVKPVIEAAKQKAWGKLGREAGKLTAKHVAGAVSESIEETLQEATSIGAASLHGEKVATVENLKRLGGAAVAGAIGYGGLGVAGAGVQTGFEQRTPGARFTTEVERELQARLDQGVDPAIREPVSLEFADPLQVEEEVKEKYDLADPNPTVEKARTEDALDAYWKVRDDRKFVIDSNVKRIREKIASLLDKKHFEPDKDQDIADVSLALMMYIDAKQYPEHRQFVDQLSKEQQQIYEMSQNLSPELQAVADEIAALDLESGQMGLEAGVLHNVLEHHIAHIWDFGEKKRGRLTGKIRTKTPFTKPRSLNTGGIFEGLARGMELRVKDVTSALQTSMQSVNEAIAGKHIIRVAKDWGIVKTRKEAGDGWVEIQHPDFTQWKHAGQVEIDPDAPLKQGTWVRAADRQNLGKIIKTSEDGQTATVHFKNQKEGAEATVQLNTADLKPVRSYGENFFVGEDGTLMERVKLWAAPEFGKTLNSIMEPSWFRTSPNLLAKVGHWGLKFNAGLKHLVLSTSLFHHQAFIRDYMFGGTGINPVQGYKMGKQAIMQQDPHARGLVRNGFTLDIARNYDLQLIHGRNTLWSRALRLTKPGEKVHKALVDIRDANERFLFGELGPYLKLTNGLLEIQAAVKKHEAQLMSGEMSMEDIYKSVATLMNNRYGGLHLGRLKRNNTAQDFFRFFCLAPDWTESNLRSAIDAFRRGDEGRLHRAFWGRVAMKGLGATVAFNLLMAAFDDEDFWERYKLAWEAGDLRWLEVDVTPIARLFPGVDSESRKYFSLIGHFKDPVKWVVHPIRSMKHKGSMAERIIHNGLTGEDWAGRKFTSVGELTGLTDPEKLGQIVEWEFGGGGAVSWETAPSYAIYEARSTLPIQAQNALAFVGGEMDSFDLITKSAGMATATHTPTKTGRTRKTRTRKRGRRKKR